MNDGQTTYSTTRTRSDSDLDVGLRSHMLQVYNYLAGGVLLTGIVSMLFAQSGISGLIFKPQGGATILGWIMILLPLPYVMVFSHGIRNWSLGAGQAMYWSFTAIMGISMSTVFLTYTATSIATTFFATSAAFAGLSLFGYTTKRDLGPVGAFCIMALWGLIAAMLINMFVGSTGMSYVLSFAGILIFSALTAYDTQKIKSMYRHGVSAEVNERTAIWGAMELYLDFVNLFLHLLRFIGVKKS